jgi:uncharacterized cupin superfamily protein
MDLPNVFTATLPPDADDPDGFRAGAEALHERLAAKELLVKVMEIEPANHLCPYHYEYVEEWLLVLSGPVEVRGPEGSRRLMPGDVMCFPAGPDGAHRVSSPADATEPARVLMFSKDADPAVCVYPDSDKLAVYTRNGHDEVFVRRSDPSSHLSYFDGEPA